MPRLSLRIAAAGCALLVTLGASGCSDDQAGASTPKPTVTTPTQTTTTTLSEKDAAIESAKEAYIKYNEFKNEIARKGGDLTKVDLMSKYAVDKPAQDLIQAAAQYKSEGRTRTGGNEVVGMSVTAYDHLTADGKGDIVQLKACIDNSKTHIFVHGVEETREPKDLGRTLYTATLQRSIQNGPWLVTQSDQVGTTGSC